MFQKAFLGLRQHSVVKGLFTQVRGLGIIYLECSLFQKQILVIQDERKKQKNFRRLIGKIALNFQQQLEMFLHPE